MTTLSNKTAQQPHALYGLCAALALALTAVAYWPGLSGPFLFDDYGTLSKLGRLGGVTDWASFKAYVSSGTAGPTGRPIALASFLLDANNWPADAWPFKRTNLVIHLLNGVLLCFLTTKILRTHRPGHQDNRWLALIAAALWLLHPFLVSTTLYAVQRMAQLSVLFVFLGMLSHLQLRALLHKRDTSAHLAMGLSLAFFTLLATLCKENGVLLPLLVGIFELTATKSHRATTQGPSRWWCLVFLWFPTAALTAYLTTHTLGGAWHDTNVTRGISVYERVITEFRVLVDYQRHWFFPQRVTSGVFQDHFEPSRSLVDPITTLASAIFHAMAILGSLLLRRKYPLLAFSLLFFYGAQLMESTVINLELYFEHRNYLACAFLYLPVVVFLRTHLSRPLFVTSIAVAVVALGGFTRNTAGVWSSFSSIVESAAETAPGSARAQQQYSQQLFNAGNAVQSLVVVNRALETMPDQSNLLLHRTILECRMKRSSVDGFGSFSSALASRPYDPRQLQFHRTLIDLVISDSCAPITVRSLQLMYEEMLDVPINADPTYVAFNQISFFIGQLDLELGQPDKAIEQFQRSLASRPQARRAMLMAAYLANYEYYEGARLFVELAEDIIRKADGNVSTDTEILKTDIAEFKRNLNEELDAAERQN